jgi:cytochrome c oxidase cbb3-type subunit III
MSDFTSNFWSWWVIAIAGGGIVWCFLLLMANRKGKLPSSGQAEATGHVWDEDLQELNNPLPRWWIIMFYLTLAFGVIYLLLYPGMGTFKGLLDWTEKGQYEAEIDSANAKYGPLYDKFLKQDIAALAADDDALKTGERLYVNYCSVCHGSDARGATGFPNLRDHDWLYGGSPEAIKTTIMDGRKGAMPSWEAPLGGDAGVEQVANYVLTLSGRDADKALAAKGKEKFDMFCVACHSADGTGNQAMGAPNLTDEIWLYGGSLSTIKKTIANGRNGVMPAHADFLGEAKVQVLAAYIYSLSNE